MKKFEVGKYYSCHSVCDDNCVWGFEIVKRTAKTITLRQGNKLVTKRPHVFEDVECCYPLGKFSMAPILSAE